ncbi:hypothetical protein ACU4GH_01355 [Bradyrhizobium betae]
MIEKRAAQRHRVFKGGTITFGNSGIPRTVRNMSAGGAAIDLDASLTLPQSLTSLDRVRRSRAELSHSLAQ